MHEIITSAHSLKKQCGGESTLQFNSRLYHFQFNLYHELFSHSNFQMQYQHFIKNVSKVKEHIAYLGKKDSQSKQQFLKVFSLEEWKQLKEEQKKIVKVA